ncbi:(deoxy)nucleoside triphosphate pyrophosphohydrolase [Mycetocola miduiensis]|uniref:(deoxy)nucleoside triphosphate pyrophosphohydrolase n=1 Tax=Mycetocola miduiensis TaxID=995034 RepID=UPI000B804CD3|nr:(deoxy)nucleoside triphosphate pyrophosphohydrolase [Mycetocola miduiensis]
MSSPAQPLNVVAAVIQHESRILVCRREPGRAQGGKWEFPGGKIEHGESPEQALIREVKEELDVEIQVLEHLTTDDTPSAGQIIRLMCFRAHLISDRPTRSSDHDELRWVRPSQLDALDWAPADVHAVAILASTAISRNE